MLQEGKARKPYALGPGAGFRGNRELPERGVIQGVRNRLQRQKAARLEQEPAIQPRNETGKDRSGDRRRG